MNNSAIKIKDEKLLQLISQFDKKPLINFYAINEENLSKIVKNMPAIDRATRIFGKQNSQVTSKLQTLNMISFSPYKRLKQCLAQIEKKKMALKSAIFKFKKNRIKYEQLLVKKEDDPFEKGLTKIKLDELTSRIADSSIYIEATIKEIGVYQEVYKEILESHNIPENWDEKDYEESEIRELIYMAFNHGVRDLEVSGRVGMGTQELLEQLGINPIVAKHLIMKYITDINNLITEDIAPSINELYKFLDNMYLLFKDEYKKALKRSGIKNIITEEYLYLEEK